MKSLKKWAIFDPYKGKFTSDMVVWLESHGHEVRTDPQGYYNPEMVDWADVVWFDTTSNNLISATNPEQALIDDWRKEQRKGEWDMHLMDMSQKTVVVRPIDIDIWTGHHASVKWDLVDHCIFLNETMRDYMMADSRPQESKMKVHVIQCGIDPNRWAYKDRKPGKNIAVVAERWVSKGVDYILQISAALPKDYKIWWLGKNNDYHWEYEYTLDFVKRNKLNIEFVEEYVEDLDAWLDDKDYLLSGSKKEAFGYNIAEAMAKGIKPVIHHFYGAENVWPCFTWNTIAEAVHEIVYGDYNSEEYLQYLIDHGYTINQMMEKVMEAISD